MQKIIMISIGRPKEEMRYILATDVGSTTTKARFFHRTYGEWRFLSTGEAPTTVEAPYENVTLGVRNAVREVEELTGHHILSEDGRGVLVPYNGKVGVDLYCTTSSAGGGLQMMVAGVIKSMTAESANRAALGGSRVIEALKEALEIGKRSGIHVHIHHHKAMGDKNAAKVKLTLPMIEEAIAQGTRVTVDMYPYLAGQGNLNAALPPWIHEGGPKEIAKKLKDRKVRDRVKKEMVEPVSMPEWESYVEQSGWETCWSGWRIVSCNKEQNKKFEGKSIAQAKPEWQDPFEFLFDLLVDEEGSVPFILPDVDKAGEEYLQMVMRHPVMMVGSDGYALAPYGPLGGGTPHPRSYGTFPRVLGRYVRDLRILSLNEAIRKMTSFPASILGLTDRGVIEEGKVADLVVFDPATVADRATFDNPHMYPQGIVHVIVNGNLVIENGEHIGALPGRVLRSTDYRH